MSTPISAPLRHSTGYAHQIKLRSACAQWMAQIAPWAIVVTITIHNVDPKSGRPTDIERIRQSIRYLLARINKACFGHRHKRHGQQVGSLFVVEHGAFGDHPHVHLTLSVPPHMPQSDFEALLHSLVRRNSIFRPQHKIGPYTSAGWMGYTLKSGVDAWDIEGTTIASP